MKYTSLSFILLSAIAGLSCTNQATESAQTDPVADTMKAVENKIQVPEAICYTNITAKDTVRLKVEIFPNVVTGSLTYQFLEKDKNQGEFKGQLLGDTLIAEYKFLSEGVLSTREIVFLLKDSIAIEGYGSLEEQNQKMVFKDGKNLNFDKGLILKKVPCN